MNKTEEIAAFWLSKIIIKISNDEIKHHFRNIERTAIRLITNKCHLSFNQCCIINKLLPTYTNIKLHDNAARMENVTEEFRLKLVERQIEEKKRIISESESKLKSLLNDLQKIFPKIRFEAFVMFLKRITENTEATMTSKHNKKLAKLYGSPILMKEERNSYLNLSSTEVNEELSEIFDLGMNFHLKTKYDQLTKKIETEKLYRRLIDLKRNDKITFNDEENLQCELKRFGLRNIRDFSKDQLTRQQYQMIKTFCNNDNIVIRKADKTNMFVIMDKQKYNSKINEILSDADKFKKIERDTTPQLKKKLRALIDTIHSVSDAPRFPNLIGNFQPGYIYGNAKIHKNKEDPPLRPIISQIGTPTYAIAKRLVDLITPYMPAQHLIKSTNEFIDILQNTNVNGYLSSLDVDSLFTNVPVQDTITIIIDEIYNNDNQPAMKIPKELLRSLLTVCTTETPFRSPDNDIYIQTDGVSMGSPLGPLFANFYMCHIENNLLPSLSNPPSMYTRYVDDIFLVIENIKTLEEIKSKFEENSVLKFTYEIEERKTIAFLDVNVKRHQHSVITGVHTKPTNSGECLNYNSFAPHQYKTGIIRTFLNRAHKICNSPDTFHAEIERIKQLLTNNNFPMKIIDAEISKFMNRNQQNEERTTNDNNNVIPLFFRNQMSSQYKQEEKNIRKIIQDHISPTDNNTSVKLQIFYKNKKLRNLFIKNNPHRPTKGDTSHVVYKYICPKEECQPSISYVGYTECTLTDRLRNHTQQGSILAHNQQAHSIKMKTQELLQHTIIERKFTEKEDLIIAEALIIKEQKPTLNAQKEGEVRVLLIF